MFKIRIIKPNLSLVRQKPKSFHGGWFRYWFVAYSAPSHYLNQWWFFYQSHSTESTSVKKVSKLILMAWCFSTWILVATVLIMHCVFSVVGHMVQTQCEKVIFPSISYIWCLTLSCIGVSTISMIIELPSYTQNKCKLWILYRYTNRNIIYLINAAYIIKITQFEVQNE